MIRAEDKLKEFFRYVHSSTARYLSSAYDDLERFYESPDVRLDLMVNIRIAVEHSLELACDTGVVVCATALHLFGDVMLNYGLYRDRIIIVGDIDAFIEFLNEVIKILSMDRRYAEWARKSWEGTVEILREIFKI